MFGNHKDEKPFNTIQKARNILSALDIFIVEEMWNSVGDNNYSVRIIDDKIPEIGTNGKGITKEYALASAYAEYLERLQSGCLYYRAYGAMKETYHKCPDEKLINNEIHIPFFDVFEQKTKYFSKNEIFRLCGSNGLCAGNSFEEAMNQGLGEIYERHLIKTIFTNSNAKFPCIPLDDFKNYDSYALIDYLTNKGFFVQFRDLTLEGTLPVLGVLLFNKERTKYSFSIASDPILETTIQRCLTELFQGLEDDDIELYKMKNVNFSSNQTAKKKFENKKAAIEHELIQTYLSGNGELPSSFFNNNYSSNSKYKKAFLSKFTSNNALLNFMINVAKKMNWDIFVRDYNFLDFTTLRIYIPNISEIYNLEETQKYNSNLNFNKLLCLGKSSKEELIKINNVLTNQENNPSKYLLKERNSNNLLNIYLSKNSDLSNTHYLVLKTLINIKIANYKEAYIYLSQYLEDKDNQIENRKYYQAVLLYLNLKVKQANDKNIFENLSLLFDDDLANEVIEDFKDEQKCFNYYSFPNCGNCSKCTEKNNCYYNQWLSRANKINKMMMKSFPNQSKLNQKFTQILSDKTIKEKK